MAQDSVTITLYEHDGVWIESRRQGEPGFVSFATDTASPYEDNRPVKIPARPNGATTAPAGGTATPRAWPLDRCSGCWCRGEAMTTSSKYHSILQRRERHGRELTAKETLTFFLLAMVLWALSGALNAQSLQYTISDLGTLQGKTNSYATGINSAGDVVGSSYSGGSDSHAFIYSGGVMTDLGTMGRIYSHAEAINDTGAIAGWLAAPGAATNHAFLLKNGTMQDLGAISYSPYNLSYANAINSSGQIAGQTSTSTSIMDAAIFSGGGIQDLGAYPGDQNSVASDINDLGQLTGWTGQFQGKQHAFFYSNSGFVDLGTLGGVNSIGRKINKSGKVTGQSDTSDGHAHAFSHTAKEGMIDLGTLGAATREPLI